MGLGSETLILLLLGLIGWLWVVGGWYVAVTGKEFYPEKLNSTLSVVLVFVVWPFFATFVLMTSKSEG